MNPAPPAIDFELVRSKRKTLGLEVRHDAKVIIRAPERLPLKQIQAFLDSQRTWILKKHQQMQSRGATRKKVLFKEGESLLFLGKYYPLTLHATQKEDVLFLKETFSVTIDARGNLKKYLFAWYQFKAEQYFEHRVKERAREMQLEFKGLKLSKAKGSWGVCTYDSKLRLNWRLILAPPAVIDYVIVHELAHTKHHNHSTRFWNLVQTFCPDYQKYKAWLHEHSYELLEYS